MAIRVNPRALLVATEKAYQGGPYSRTWAELPEDNRKSVLAQAELLLRSYDDAKAADLAVRRAEPQE